MRGRVVGLLGVLLVLVGIVWILQGLNVLPGSMMSGQLVYAILGLVVGAAGAGLAWRSFGRRPRASRRTGR